MKTIFMPKAIKDAWLAALRSGKYEQGNGALKDSYGRYCCLGVLQHCVDRKVESRMYDGRPMAFPTIKWYASKGIVLDGSMRDPYLPKLLCSASSANDSGMSFAKIADALEDCISTTDLVPVE